MPLEMPKIILLTSLLVMNNLIVYFTLFVVLSFDLLNSLYENNILPVPSIGVFTLTILLFIFNIFKK